MLVDIAEIPRSVYYYQVKQLNKLDKYVAVKADIMRIFNDENQGRYGYRRVTCELRKTMIINHKTIQRLMREMGLYSMVRAKKYHSHKGEVGVIATNIINRDFHADNQNEKWVTDVTEFNLFGQKLYFSPILDLYNSEVISYALAPRPRMSLVMNMLDDAISKLPKVHNLILHSDQGWHYQMKNYQRKLKVNGITQSMSRKATCLDNAVMENLFGVLKTELLYIREFDSMEHFIEELHAYIHYYNYRRIKTKFRMSPVQYRNRSISAA